jgi:hypothetical protein
MARHYGVGHDYRARYGSVPLSFAEGDEVEVDDAVAKWVNDDSPGTLLPLDVPESNPEPVEGVVVESETAGTGEAVNAETGEVTAPGEPLPVIEQTVGAELVAEAPVEDVKARGGLLRGKRSGGSK